MKEQAIQKINKIGKVSSIITLVAKILVGIGLAASLIVAIICFVIPESMLKFNMDGEMTVEVDYASLGLTMTEEEIAAAQEELDVEMISGGEEVDFTEVIITEDKITMTGEVDAFSITMKDIAWIWLLALVVLTMTFVTLFFVGSLCKAFRDCQSPFDANVIKKMQNLAISLIPWAIVSSVANSISNSLLNNKISINFTIDLGVILIVLIVFVLVYIFKYGAVLQQESDETL